MLRKKLVIEYCLLAGFGCILFGVDSAAQSAEPSKSSDCPKITVVGPAGVSEPGDMIWFEATLEPEPNSSIKFNWTASAGKVDEGQSTKKIGVRYLMDMRGTTLVATVEVKGLPKECAVFASEAAPLTWDPRPELLSEFTVPIASIHKQNLRSAAADLNRNPNSQMFIVEYFPKGTNATIIERKHDQIMTYMTRTVKFDGSRITLVTAVSERTHTKIYRVPPGADNPNP